EFLETDRLKEPEEKGMIQLPGTDIKVSRKEAMSELKTLGGLLKAGGGQGVVGEDFKIQDAQAMVSDPGVLKQVQEMAKSEDPFQKRLADRFMTLASALYPESEQEQRARGEAPVGEGTGGADVPAPEGMPENLKTKVLEASKRGKAILLKDGRTLWFNGSEIVEQ
ncbi:MAG: hypothetical protein SVS15_04650, partial [Thermodesulfobacteriota bacterium]|nr:hypothetical protein [Thermodesulfobacteriota bacterium]